MLQWVDFLYSQEGAILASIGQENVDYLVDGDGSWRLIESNQNNYDMYRAGTLIEGGAEGPGVMTGDFQSRISGGTLIKTILEKQARFSGNRPAPGGNRLLRGYAAGPLGAGRGRNFRRELCQV